MIMAGDRKPGQARGAGTSGNQKGKAWMRRCIRALWSIGYKGAEVIPGHGRADIGGIGDLAIECKDEATWEHLSHAWDQAEEAVRFRSDVSVGVVWRKRWGYPDPLDGWIVIGARKWWEHWAEHQRLEAVELEFKAWRKGLADAAQAREAAG